MKLFVSIKRNRVPLTDSITIELNDFWYSINIVNSIFLLIKWTFIHFNNLYSHTENFLEKARNISVRLENILVRSNYSGADEIF